MKKKLLIISSIATMLILGLVFQTNLTQKNKMDVLREKHITALKNSPFKETKTLSKSERKAQGLPPNSYYERDFELTLDPNSGRPHPERLFQLQKSLNSQFSRVPGENSNDWVERGPNNVGGRTRAIMFDPNDATNKRVFAGGVSGGLWLNTDITDASVAWTEVNLPKNLAISCITHDPNDTNTFYVGTGESYVFGDVNGNGLWRSKDGGLTWSNVFGGVSGALVQGIASKVTVNSPASIAGDSNFVPASFGPAVGTFSGELVLVADGTIKPREGCNALTNGGALIGKIAVIVRGNCEFGKKVLNAENAGAVAAIIINNVPGAAIPMGPGNDGGSVTIPSLMISQADGAGILTELGNGNPVNVTVTTGSSTHLPGVQHINDVKIRDIGNGNSEIYVAASASFYSDASPSVLLGTDAYGLYKSTNGTSWSKVTLPATPNNYEFVPNDIEIGKDNKIWLSTTNIPGGSSDGSGTILSSSNGITFEVKHVIPNARRTQIAVSKQNANTIYVLSEVRSDATKLSFIKTTNGFTSTTNVSLPNDVDTGIPANDFTRGQAFYDLLLEVAPNNDQTVYTGGIDLFRSTNGGSAWTQISKWSNNNNLSGLNVSLVHADHHAMTFHPTDPNKAVFGNDGGVFYASTLSGASNNGGAIGARNKNYNVTQFYKGAIGSETGSEKLLAGAQDNGSQLINNAGAGIGSSNQVTGGDGAYCFIDKDNGYMVTSYVYNNFYYRSYANGGAGYDIVADDGSGDFINPAGLDSESNILYTNGSSGATIQVNKYILNANSATATTFTDALLTGAPTAFKALSKSGWDNFVLIGTEDGKLLHLKTTGFGGSTWTDITGPNFAGSISCIEKGATENDLYVTFHNYGVTSVFYSSDGGTTWASKEGNLPDIPVRAIMANPLNANEVILGTNLGVWATKNFSSANPTWYQSQDGMKDVVVTSFDLRTADNTVLASTYGRGMFTGQFTAAQSNLSVDDFTQNKLIKIYPTVSNGEITIAPTSEVREGALAIYDMNGRLVHNSELDFSTGANKQVSLNLSSGVYVVKFTTNDIQSSQKIIIE